MLVRPQRCKRTQLLRILSIWSPAYLQAWRIRRQLRRAHGTAAGAVAHGKPALSAASNGGLSPKPSALPAPLAAVAEEGSEVEASSHVGAPVDGPLGRRHLSSRSFHGGPLTYNSAPLPDLLPPRGGRGAGL